MTRDLRVPSTVMANTSRPPWVVPNQCSAEGGWRKPPESTCVNSQRPRRLPTRAKSTTRRKPTMPITAEGLRTKRRAISCRRDRRLLPWPPSRPGASSTAPVVAACATWWMSDTAQPTLTLGSTIATNTSDRSAPVRVHSPEKATTAVAPLISIWEIELTEYSPMPCQV